MEEGDEVAIVGGYDNDNLSSGSVSVGGYVPNGPTSDFLLLLRVFCVVPTKENPAGSRLRRGWKPRHPID